MATTSPDDIWTPDAGDDYALTTDLAAMADTVQDAITANKNSLVGLDASRPADGSPGLSEGMTWYSTDTGVLYRYVGSSWSIELRPLTTYTPTVSGLNMAQVTISAKYMRVRNMVSGFILVDRTVAGNPTGSVSFSLPTTPANTTVLRSLGEGTVYLQNNTTAYIAPVRYAGGTFVAPNISAVAGSAVAQGTNVNATFPTSAAHGVGTSFYLPFQYETA